MHSLLCNSKINVICAVKVPMTLFWIKSNTKDSQFLIFLCGVPPAKHKQLIGSNMY